METQGTPTFIPTHPHTETQCSMLPHANTAMVRLSVVQFSVDSGTFCKVGEWACWECFWGSGRKISMCRALQEGLAESVWCGNARMMFNLASHWRNCSCWKTSGAPSALRFMVQPQHEPAPTLRFSPGGLQTRLQTVKQCYNLWTQRREMGRGHRAGGWTNNHNIVQHPPVTQWVHWCTWLPNISYSSISPSPSIAWHRWCCWPGKCTEP